MIVFGKEAGMDIKLKLGHLPLVLLGLLGFSGGFFYLTKCNYKEANDCWMIECTGNFNYTPLFILRINLSAELARPEPRKRESQATVVSLDGTIQNQKHSRKHKSISIAKEILNSILSEEITETDLTTAEEVVRGLTFDEYQEKIACEMLEGIASADFETVVGRIAKRNNIPEDKRELIMDGQYAQKKKSLVREFAFTKGKPGEVVYAMFITVKKDDSTIDLAYSLFQLNFKLAPKRIQTKIDKWFLDFIKVGSSTEIRFEDRNLSEKDKKNILNFFRNKALLGFRNEYPLLAGKQKQQKNEL